MDLNKLYLTKNECYLTGKTMIPKGVMVHSTGVNNPNLNRYVGPDDGRLGQNDYNNHWNTACPDGRKVCAHAFIGKLVNGNIATYQTLPWNYVGWHSGSGFLGKAKNANNTGYIGFEICEDRLDDPGYFTLVYREAIELCVYLCRQFGLVTHNIISHSEGYKLGIASNHADVMHWFPRHGKSMDTFRAAVKSKLTGTRKFESYNIYTVKEGDTLWGIALGQLGNETRFKEIKRLNGLRSNTIFPEQKLKIPKE